nr:hypothetical protein [Nocardia cerradoensis]
MAIAMIGAKTGRVHTTAPAAAATSGSEVSNRNDHGEITASASAMVHEQTSISKAPACTNARRP